MEVETKLKLSGIFIYPIKSLGAVELDSAQVMEQGLKYDRRWMLLDSNGRFMTIRNRPEFIYFKVSLHSDGFLVNYKSHEILVPFEPILSQKISTQVWDDTFEGIKGDPELDRWFSTMLGESCSLIYIPSQGNRFIKPDWGVSRVSLADGYPYLIVGENSLRDLNEKLPQAIEMSRFRPNLIFSEGQPYEEYKWSAFSIGDVRFQGLKPCERCVVTTYDLQSGQKGREPLLTLSKQKVNDRIVFGQHTTAMSHGKITIGDDVKVETFKHSPYDAI